VFVGFNPSLPAWRTGHYYANPGNRFYRLLFDSGLTPRLLTPSEDRSLPEFGIGATDLVAEPSAKAEEIAKEKYLKAVQGFEKKISEYAPKAICCNGLGVYRYLFGGRPIHLGRVPEIFMNGSLVFVTPSTSGLCNGQAAARLAAFKELSTWRASLGT
jgi:double-stranded uracil-DNA glycosylase